MEVYHFSENPAIREFIPRSPIAHPEIEPLVWAIDLWHAPLYYFPSDCPRACFWNLPTTTPEDHERWLSVSSGKMVIAIEQEWVARLRATTLYRYAFDDAGFIHTGDHGVAVSRHRQVPLRVEPITDLLSLLMEADIELRLCPSLIPLAQSLIESTLHFSLIRMRNAKGWTGAKGTPTVPK